MNTSVLVPSWDGYRDVWPAFFHCFFKYWPDCPFTVFLGTNAIHYSDDRVTSLLIGQDVDYSSNLLLMLQSVSHDWVIVWVDDFLLSRAVDTNRLLHLVELAQAEQATSLLLHSTHSLRSVARRVQEIAQLPESTPYLVSLNPALWRKTDLVQLLRKGENPWRFERKGTGRARESNCRFYGVTSLGGGPPLSTVNALVKGKVTPEALVLLRHENLRTALENWPRLSAKSVFYRRIRAWIPNVLVNWRHAMDLS